MDIGTIIRNRRLELNLTLEEIGNAVGVEAKVQFKSGRMVLYLIWKEIKSLH